MYKTLPLLTEVLHRNFSRTPRLVNQMDHLSKYNGKDWIEYLHILKKSSEQCKNEKWEKTPTIIEKNNLFQLSLIRWSPMKTIPFHDHHMIDSAFIVLKGQIRESRMPYAPPHNISTFVINKGECSYITTNCQTLHQLENNTPGESVSLHLNAFTRP